VYLNAPELDRGLVTAHLLSLYQYAYFMMFLFVTQFQKAVEIKNSAGGSAEDTPSPLLVHLDPSGGHKSCEVARTVKECVHYQTIRYIIFYIYLL
jgi:hypothetical protein